MPMGVAAQSQLERAELESVTGSGIFSRAPNLASFLSYICEQHFAGAAGRIKEYNIAVDALGRPADFDQRRDSIVRVEAHRLRKRLAEYYAGAGANHLLRIEIPNGQYAPVFVAQAELPAELPDAGVEETAVPTGSLPDLPAFPEPRLRIVKAEPVNPLPTLALPLLTLPVAARRRRGVFVVVAIAFFAAASLLVFRTNLMSALRGSGSAAAEVWTGNAVEPVPTEFRMLAGYHGKPFSDRQGHRWEPDSYYSGGASAPIPGFKSIEGLPDPDLFHAFREGNFRYAIPLRPGVFELHLLFAETILGRGNLNEGEDVRSFRMDINGQERLDLFDVMSEAGAPNRLHVKVFKDIMPAKDGKLHLDFIEQSGLPILNGIEILASAPGKVRPIRMVAQKASVMDVEGRLWAGDQYVSGGHLVERRRTIDNLQQKNLYLGERFGNFTYRLPVAPGKYRLKLHFAETYLGSKAINNAPPYRKGARLFNVSANGDILLRDFDITEAAGGVNLGLVRTFEGLEPNAQGLIVLEFRPLRNYACVNAIELEQMD